MWLSGFYAMTLTMSELSARAGLNLGFDRFELAASTQVFGQNGVAGAMLIMTLLVLEI